MAKLVNIERKVGGCPDKVGRKGGESPKNK